MNILSAQSKEQLIRQIHCGWRGIAEALPQHLVDVESIRTNDIFGAYKFVQQICGNPAISKEMFIDAAIVAGFDKELFSWIKDA